MRLSPPALACMALLIAQGLAFADAATPFRRADTNSDGTVDISDGVYTLGFLFLGSTQPPCFDAADANDSGGIDLSDAVFTFAYLFLSGAEPPAPGTSDCGPDPTTDGLACDLYAPANEALRCAVGGLPFVLNVDVPPRSLATVSLTFAQPRGDLDLTAYDSNGTCLGGRVGSSCTWNDRQFETGEEHLSVLNASTSARARYTFRVEGHAGATNEYEISTRISPWTDGQDCAAFYDAAECEGRPGSTTGLLQFPYPDARDALVGDGYRLESPANYRWLRRELLMLIRFALAETRAKFPGTKPLGLLDMSQSDGITPGYDIDNPRHPESTYDQGGNIDMAYFTTLATSGAIEFNQARVICDANGGSNDGSYCSPGAAQTHVVDLERQVYFMAKLFESARVRVIGVDRVLAPLLRAEAERQLGLGWITTASRQAFQSKLGFGEGWPFHHHHIHVSLQWWPVN